MKLMPRSVSVPKECTAGPSVPLGTIQQRTWIKRAKLRVAEALLRAHLVIFGGTRQGKSKLFECVCRGLLELGRGFAFIDPHSDTADDLLAYLAARAGDGGAIPPGHIYYLNPNDRLFSFDPFRYRPAPDDPQGDTDFRYRSWLHTKIKDMVNIIVRQQGETDDEKQKMVRLRRWLFNALYAVGVRQDDAGTHLPLKDAFALLNPAHPRHEELYERVEPFLTDEVRSDFQKLRATRDPRKQEDWVESTFNRLRDILSPIVERIFNLEAPTIDFRAIIREGGVILAALGKTEMFHEDEALAIAGLLIREISEAARTVQREERRPFHLFLDEAQHFLGDDLLRILKESGKYGLALGLAVQGLDNLQKGQVDLVPAVLGQCGIRITFRQQYHEHAEVLAKSLCYPMLDFRELVHEVDRDGGYRWVLVRSTTVGQGTATNVAVSQGRSSSQGTAHAIGSAHSRSASHIQSAADGYAESQSGARSYHEWSSRSRSQTRGIAASQSNGTTESNSLTTSATESETASFSRGTSRSTNRSYTLQPTPLHTTRVEKQKTGRLERAVADQFAKFAAGISSLRKQHCLVAVAAFNRAFVLRVDDVVDPFEERFTSPDWRKRAIDEFKARIFASHPCYFVPEHAPPRRIRTDSSTTNGKPRLSHRPPTDPSPFPG